MTRIAPEECLPSDEATESEEELESTPVDESHRDHLQQPSKQIHQGKLRKETRSGTDQHRSPGLDDCRIKANPMKATPRHPDHDH